MTEDKIRELFREMRDEPVPADSRARVRMAVAERSQSWQERLRRYWKIPAIILVPVCAVLVALSMREPARIVLPPPVVVREAEPIAPVQTPAVTPPVVRVRHRVVKKVRPAEAATLIRIDTPDPDVVILLIGG